MNKLRLTNINRIKHLLRKGLVGRIETLSALPSYIIGKRTPIYRTRKRLKIIDKELEEYLFVISKDLAVSPYNTRYRKELDLVSIELFEIYEKNNLFASKI